MWFASWLRSLFSGKPGGVLLTDNSDPDESARPEEPVEIRRGRVLAIDREGWVTGDGVVRVPTARHSGIMKSKEPLGIVWHWTATGGGTGKTIANAWKKKPAAGQHVGSAHLVIERDGTIYSLAPLHYSCWHAIGGPVAGKYRVNQCMVGVEMVAVGRVAKKKDDKYRGWAAEKGVGYGPAVPEEEVTQWGSKYYHYFSPEQIKTMEQLTALITSKYNMEPGLATTDHKLWDPRRKEDCGPIWEGRLKPVLFKVAEDARGRRI